MRDGATKTIELPVPLSGPYAWTTPELKGFRALPS